jgi:hypothetical protein
MQLRCVKNKFASEKGKARRAAAAIVLHYGHGRRTIHSEQYTKDVAMCMVVLYASGKLGAPSPSSAY